MTEYFPYQEFHASLVDKSEIADCNAVAPRHEWVEDTYEHKVDGKTVKSQVKDVYQWLEDPDSKETKRWVNCQVDMCDQFLNSLKVSKDDNPDAKESENKDEKENDKENNADDSKLLRKEIEDNLKENLKFGRFSTPYRKKEYYFYRYNQGTWNQSKLFVLPKGEVDSYLTQLREKSKSKGKDKDEKEEKALELCTDDDHVLIDPNTLAADGTSQLKSIYHSEHGQLMAYTVSKKGSDWVEIHLKNVKEFVDAIGSKAEKAKAASKDAGDTEAKAESEEKEQADVLKHCKFTGVSWTHDHKGFFYTRYDAPKTAGKDGDADKDKDKDKDKDDKEVKETDKSLGTETAKLRNQQLYYHKCGDLQSSDTFIIDAKTFGDDTWLIGHRVTIDGKYLLITLSSDCDPVNRVFICQRSDGGMITGEDGGPSILKNMVKLVDNFDAGYGMFTNEGSMFYFRTNFKAPNYRVIRIDIASKDTLDCIANGKALNWEEIIKERECRLDVARCVGHSQQYLYLDYTIDVKTQLFLTSMDGKAEPYLINKVDADKEGCFPAHGCLGAWGSRHYDEGFIFFESWLHPGSIYHYDYVTKELLRFAQIKPKNFDADAYATEQVYFRYKKHPICKGSIRHNRFEIVKASRNKQDLMTDKESDDVSPIIPMYILYKKILMDTKTQRPFGNRAVPTTLYGYGGFDISLLPYFSALRLCWLKNLNGIYAVANIRGGGEYGEKWHEQGTKLQKQNVFNDFQAAATCLIEELKYTSPNNLTIEGGSNGGLLVGACCNQRPDLFQCGIAHVGVMDMLKFHKFTIGYAWTSDFGSSENKEDKAEFDYLYEYSPLHNIPDPSQLKKNNGNDNEIDNILAYGAVNQYPCFLALTADHDDRVVPLHSFKFMAELQYKFAKYKKQKNPLLVRIDVSAGHGGSNLSKAIKNRADVYTFLAKCMNLKWINDSNKDNPLKDMVTTAYE